ncbi:hypothetical protein NPIL_647551 [Nephila pilipes]|uniref:Uncharacterized protein n=1 Tax=Nephila pilipes TaxID=299642 RepID=A0A8X6PB97_NEPPI|nr:hypothetical protein NPIL_647551 [Nephila pilipes]
MALCIIFAERERQISHFNREKGYIIDETSKKILAFDGAERLESPGGWSSKCSETSFHVYHAILCDVMADERFSALGSKHPQMLTSLVKSVDRDDWKDGGFLLVSRAGFLDLCFNGLWTVSSFEFLGMVLLGSRDFVVVRRFLENGPQTIGLGRWHFFLRFVGFNFLRLERLESSSKANVAV